MSATQRNDTEEYQRAQAAIRESRELVGDQLHDLVVERQGLGAYDELVDRVRRIGDVGRELAQARGREAQAEEMGLATGLARRQQNDAKRLLRAAVMSLGEACGSYVVALDFEARRIELDAAARIGPKTRRRADEDDDI